jgi:hypothetical protein
MDASIYPSKAKRKVQYSKDHEVLVQHSVLVEGEVELSHRTQTFVAKVRDTLSSES